MNDQGADKLHHFDGLSAYDFEVLVCDLLAKKWGMHLESFAAGPDDGIDVRHLGDGTPSSPNVIVQCKHYEKSGYSTLKSRMKKEALKILARPPKRYVLATTVEMTPFRKKELAETLSGLIASESDILGREDIGSLLREFPDVEKAHFKLWLNSTAVLERIIHNDVISRTEGYVDDLLSRAALFVENQSVTDAEDILQQEHVCLISGAPGVGKTSLANVLLMLHIERGYEPVIVSDDITEAQKLFRKQKKQVFLYDDFLGRTTTFEKLGKNEDRRLLSLMRQVSKSNTKRLILTTRSHVLEQAKVVYDLLADDAVDLAKYHLDVSIYTKKHKAHILYNHLWFSELTEEHRRKLVESRSYQSIVASANYNPRIVETAIDFAVREEVVPDSLSEFLTDAFEHPRRLWQHLLQGQLSIEQRVVCGFLALTEGTQTLDSLEGMYLALAAAPPTGVLWSQSFDECLRGLEGSILRIEGSRIPQATFSNPGVEDAVLEFVLSQPEVLRVLIPHATSSAQIIRLWNHGNEPATSTHFDRAFRKSQMLPRCEQDKLLRPAFRRVFDAFSHQVVDRMIQLAIGTAMWGTRSEARLLPILTMAQGFDIALARNRIDILTVEMYEYWKLGKGEKSQIWSLVSFAYSNTNCLEQDVRDELLTKGMKCLVEVESKSVEDFKALHEILNEAEDDNFASTFADLPTPEQLLEEFEHFLFSEVDRLRDSAELHEARGEIDDLADLSNELGIDFDDYSGDIWTLVDEAEAEFGESEWEGGDDRPSSIEDHADPDDIDALFDSLYNG